MMKLNIVYLSGEMSPILLKPGERRLMVPMNDDVVASGEMAEIHGECVYAVLDAVDCVLRTAEDDENEHR